MRRLKRWLELDYISTRVICCRKYYTYKDGTEKAAEDTRAHKMLIWLMSVIGVSMILVDIYQAYTNYLLKTGN